jgi:ATP-dependent Clp protease ATP-binding subunit ClpC
VQAAVEGEAVQGRKDDGLDAVSRPGFWDDDARFEVLADVEYLDRLEAAHGTAERLGARLRAQADRRGQVSAELVGLLARRLYVLDAALAGLADGAPRELYLRLRPLGAADGQSAEFARTLTEMYGAWAAARGMHLELVDGAADVAHVSGLGAGTILAPEAGLHVLEVVGPETPAGDRPVDRIAVAVELVPRDARAVGLGAEAGVDELFRAVAGQAEVVRRYRPGASPLVRDAVRGYRTGRLDRVLAGDFDLF